MQEYKYAVLVTDKITNEKHYIKDDVYPGTMLFKTSKDANQYVQDEYSRPDETYEIKDLSKEN